jgi:hypothetical protein
VKSIIIGKNRELNTCLGTRSALYCSPSWDIVRLMKRRLFLDQMEGVTLEDRR